MGLRQCSMPSPSLFVCARTPRRYDPYVQPTPLPLHIDSASAISSSQRPGSPSMVPRMPQAQQYSSILPCPVEELRALSVPFPLACRHYLRKTTSKHRGLLLQICRRVLLGGRLLDGRRGLRVPLGLVLPLLLNVSISAALVFLHFDLLFACRRFEVTQGT